MLYDNHGRHINYLRLAVTDRCNLRCFYCMPEHGIDYIDRSELLTYEEMERLLLIFADLGIDKLRITGGEPFVRKGMMEFLEKIAHSVPLREINITTNGTFTTNYVERIKKAGIGSVNLSLDSLNAGRFYRITRRDMFDEVMDTFHKMLRYDLRVKINMVVMEGKNTEDIYPMIELTKQHPVSVRFIEEMPFNGTEGQGNTTFWPERKILDHIKKEYTSVEKIADPAHSTSKNYRISGYAGTFGTIAAYTRTFCGSCNRIRLTPQGTLRTCLYGEGKVNFRDLMRSGASDREIGDQLKNTLQKRAIDGFQAEEQRRKSVSESMATIGG